MEVCVDSLYSAQNAYEGNANRIELCSSLGEGGLTPSYGLFKSVRKYLDKKREENENRIFKIHCMIRCRSGDFNYSDLEIESMHEDIKKFIELGTDGLVYGGLTPDGSIDENLMSDFLKLIPSNIKTTYHRAFDVCSNWKDGFEIIQKLGFDFLLTSGQKKNAFEGRDLIAKLVRISEVSIDNRKNIIIMPGCGINSNNLHQILEDTKCKEFHASCSSTMDSKMIFRNKDIPMGSNQFEEFSIKYTDRNKVQELSDIYRNFYKIK
jgi:copper homeostasis protein